VAKDNEDRPNIFAYVPMENPKAHVVVIGVGYNPIMRKYDVTLDIGNCATDTEAKRVAKLLADLVAKHLGFKIERAQ
jgi:biotin-(acetyl-CoA carboxylase) ligase